MAVPAASGEQLLLRRAGLPQPPRPAGHAGDPARRGDQRRGAGAGVRLRPDARTRSPQAAGVRAAGGGLPASRHLCDRGQHRRPQPHLRGARTARADRCGGCGPPRHRRRSSGADRSGERAAAARARDRTRSWVSTCGSTGRSTRRRTTRSSRTRLSVTTTSPPASGACSPTGCPTWPATSASTVRCSRRSSRETPAQRQLSRGPRRPLQAGHPGCAVTHRGGVAVARYTWYIYRVYRARG